MRAAIFRGFMGHFTTLSFFINPFTILAGWWFGTWFLFSIIYGTILPIEYFSRWLKPPTSLYLGWPGSNLKMRIIWAETALGFKSAWVTWGGVNQQRHFTNRNLRSLHIWVQMSKVKTMEDILMECLFPLVHHWYKRRPAHWQQLSGWSAIGMMIMKFAGMINDHQINSVFFVSLHKSTWIWIN